MNQSDPQDPSKKQRHRSPNYPAVGLREAVERVRKLYGEDGKAGAPPEIAAVHIGFSKPHGQAMSVLAALKRFGLISEGNGRVIPTQRAMEIMNLPLDDPRRAQALRDAVVEPAIYSQLIEQHKDTGWPKADVLESELETYRNFNPRAVREFVANLFDSLEFAGLSDLTVVKPKQERSETGSEWVRPQVGDYVQSESQGVPQFSTPRRVTGLSPDGTHAFVDGTTTGLAIKDLIVEDRPTDGNPQPSPKSTAWSKVSPSIPVPHSAATRQEIFSLDEGNVTVEWPASLSKESFQDVSDWLDILKRKIGRSIVKADNSIG